jgi:hypothetical protein
MAPISSVSAVRRTMSKYPPVTMYGHEMCNAPQDNRRLDRRPDNHPIIGDHVKSKRRQPIGPPISGVF